MTNTLLTTVSILMTIILPLLQTVLILTQTVSMLMTNNVAQMMSLRTVPTWTAVVGGNVATTLAMVTAIMWQMGDITNIIMKVMLHRLLWRMMTSSAMELVLTCSCRDSR